MHTQLSRAVVAYARAIVQNDMDDALHIMTNLNREPENAYEEALLEHRQRFENDHYSCFLLCDRSLSADEDSM